MRNTDIALAYAALCASVAVWRYLRRRTHNVTHEELTGMKADLILTAELQLLYTQSQNTRSLLNLPFPRLDLLRNRRLASLQTPSPFLVGS